MKNMLERAILKMIWNRTRMKIWICDFLVKNKFFWVLKVLNKLPQQFLKCSKSNNSFSYLYLRTLSYVQIISIKSHIEEEEEFDEEMGDEEENLEDEEELDENEQEEFDEDEGGDEDEGYDQNEDQEQMDSEMDDEYDQAEEESEEIEQKSQIKVKKETLNGKKSNRSEKGQKSEELVKSNGGQKEEDVQIKSDKEKSNPKALKSILKNQSIPNLQYQDPQAPEIQKNFTRSFNRLSEGNIDPIFSNILSEFQKNAKNTVTPICIRYIYIFFKKVQIAFFQQLIRNFYEQIYQYIFSEQFIRFTVEPAILQSHQIAVNCAVVTIIHDFFDNQVFAVFMAKLLEKFCKLFFESEQEKQDYLKGLNSDEIQEKLILKKSQKKNVVLVMCHLYIYDSLSLDFIKGLLRILLKEIQDEEDIDLLSQVIHYLGHKIRKESPTILKELIREIEKKLQEFPDSIKAKFIKLLLQDIRMNKNLKTNPMERMSFILNWMKRYRDQQKLSKKLFVLSFEQTIEIDKTQPKWWIPMLEKQKIADLNQSQGFTEEEFLQEIGIKENQYKKLEELAVSYKMATEIRKRIFVTVMSSEDYVDCTQKIFKLKLNKQQQKDVPLVLLECTMSEKQFNPYYVLVMKKICQINKKIKYFLVLNIYDKFKVMQSFSLRKIFNFGKFCAFLACEDILSINILRPLDLELPTDYDMIFLKIFMKQYLKKVQPKLMISQVQKICKNEENIIFVEGFRTFIKQKYVLIEDDQNLQQRAQVMAKNLKIETLDMGDD